MAKKFFSSIGRFLRALWRRFVRFWRGAWRHKLIVVLLGLCLAILASSYGVARWYIASNQSKPLQLGVTYVADYANALGVDPQKTYTAILHDLGVRQLRLVSYWNKIEAKQGTYDFSELDWQMAEAEKVGAQVSLAIGLRQPRWPECHMPDWAAQLPAKDWQARLDAYITAVVQRYKDSPALQSWQLENEYFLTAFGECPTPDRARLTKELALVHKLDNKHPVIMSRSDNKPALLLRSPQPDIVGASVYRRVWNDNLYKGYFNYPLPAWYYAAVAGWQKIFTGKDTVLHEMQMEPWPPHGQFVANVSREEQDKSMNASMFAARVAFAERTGMRTIDLWGAEWWYYRKVVLHDDSVWQEARRVFANH